VKSPEYVFSVAAMVRAITADTWQRIPSKEFAACMQRRDQFGIPADRFERIPDDVLVTRDLNLSAASAGGYLADTQQLGYVESLLAAGVVTALTTPATAGPGGVATPIGSTPVTPMWLTSETQQITESTPGFKSAAATPKLLGAFCEISRQLLLQSNAEELLRREMRNAAAAAVDAAILGGSGAAGQPLGAGLVTGIATFTGAALSQAAARNAQRKILDANAIVVPRSLAYVTTPAIGETLATRQRFTGSDRTLWEGASNDGTMEGQRALATTSCPAATCFFADWSSVWVVQWPGGLQLLADPFTKSATGIVGIRMLFPIDLVYTRPPSIAVATSVS
jgi:HK97 family phage major capsid protein